MKIYHDYDQILHNNKQFILPIIGRTAEMEIAKKSAIMSRKTFAFRNMIMFLISTFSLNWINFFFSPISLLQLITVRFSVDE